MLVGHACHYNSNLMVNPICITIFEVWSLIQFDNKGVNSHTLFRNQLIITTKICLHP